MLGLAADYFSTLDWRELDLAATIISFYMKARISLSAIYLAERRSRAQRRRRRLWIETERRRTAVCPRQQAEQFEQLAAFYDICAEDAVQQGDPMGALETLREATKCIQKALILTFAPCRVASLT